MKLLFENWRKFLNEGIFYVNAAQLLPAEELGHGKNDEGYDVEQAVAEKMQQIQQGKLEPIEVCNQKPVNPYRLADKPMEKSGQAEPFYYVLDGHHRLEAINRLGVERVPVYLTSKEINEAVEDVYTGNCGMFGIALAEEALQRGIQNAALVFAHNADTDEDLMYGDYKLYHVALKIGDKIYDGRGEIPLSKLVSFMWEAPEDMNVDAFNLKNLESMKDAIRRNTAWTETCEAYREQAKDFLDEMGYEQNKDSNYNVSEAKDINKIAKAVIVKDNKALILLRASSEKKGGRWDLPGGHLNEGEELMEGLLREVYEETGLTLAEPVESLYTKENTSFFKAGMPQEDIKLSHEHTKYKFISVDEIPENISSRFIKAIKATL